MANASLFRAEVDKKTNKIYGLIIYSDSINEENFDRIYETAASLLETDKIQFKKLTKNKYKIERYGDS
jgi:hypothetical protein